mmetsp:Transcript_23406/g.75477  ORF Transcript_23406/g.75477 Transcript_23406/m.75477 type:complete len:225 (-) Transcript_23406:312-986(-)
MPPNASLPPSIHRPSQSHLVSTARLRLGSFPPAATSRLGSPRAGGSPLAFPRCSRPRACSSGAHGGELAGERVLDDGRREGDLVGGVRKFELVVKRVRHDDLLQHVGGGGPRRHLGHHPGRPRWSQQRRMHRRQLRRRHHRVPTETPAPAPRARAPKRMVQQQWWPGRQACRSGPRAFAASLRRPPVATGEEQPGARKLHRRRRLASRAQSARRCEGTRGRRDI